MALTVLLALDACAGPGRSLGYCQRVSTGAGPENFVILAHEGRQWVLLGSAERGGLRGRMRPGRIEAVELHEDGRLRGGSQQIEPKGWSQDEASQFRPVGMFLDPETSSDCRILYVVNALGRSIERFCISFEQPSGEVPFSLVHDGTLPPTDEPKRRHLNEPNDVVAAPSGRVFISSFMWGGHIARFERGVELADDSRGLAGPNGLAYDPKRNLLYVAVFYDQSIRVFNLTCTMHEHERVARVSVVWGGFYRFCRRHGAAI